MELHAIDAGGFEAGGIAVDTGFKAGALQFQRRQFAGNRLIQRKRGVPAFLRDHPRLGGEQGLARGDIPLEADKLGLAMVQCLEIAREFRGERGKVIHGRLVLPPGGTQGKKPLLDPLQFTRVEFRLPQLRLEALMREIKRLQRGVERGDGPGAWSPERMSAASRRSPVIFSACIIR
jgi:hypothetical protein